MANTTITDTGTIVSVPFETPPTAITPLGAAGVTPGGIVFEKEPLNYTLVVQIPMPWFNLGIDVNLLGDFILPALSTLGIPQAVAYFTTNMARIIQRTIDAAWKLIRTYPQMTVTILVKIGPVIVVNIILVAKLVPTPVPLPVFSLDLPNFVAGINLTLPFPLPPPVTVEVNVPVPVFSQPLINITGGNVSLGAAGEVTGVAISNQAYHPVI